MRSGKAIRTKVVALVVGGAWLSAVSLGFSVGQVSAAASRAVAPCHNFQLTIRPFQSSAGMGHVATTYRVHNLLRAACTLFGYPGAKLLDRDFNSLTTHVRRGLVNLTGKPAPAVVTLRGPRDGYFVLEWDHFPSPGETCPPATYLLITPPNDRLPVVTFAATGGSAIVACGGTLTASPVTERLPSI